MPATDINQYALVSASSIFAVYIAVTFVKPLLELALPPTHRLHDWAVRLCACLFGVLLVVLATALLHPLVPQMAFLAVTQGIACGLASVGAYHLVSTADTSAAVVQAPPAQPAEPTAVVVPPANTPTVVVQPPTAAPDPTLPPVPTPPVPGS
jgi:hypothetical protein